MTHKKNMARNSEVSGGIRENNTYKGDADVDRVKRSTATRVTDLMPLEKGTVVSNSLSDLLKRAELACQTLTYESQKLGELGDRVTRYRMGMEDFLEELKSQKSTGKIGRTVGKISQKAGRIKYLGDLLRIAEKGLGHLFQTTMDELETGGLTSLENDFQDFHTSIIPQFQALQEVKDLLEGILEEKRNELGKVSSPNLQGQITLLELQISNADTALEIYKSSVVALLKDIPEGLQYIATGLLSYKISKAATDVSEVHEAFRGLSQNATLIPFESVAQVAGLLQTNASTPLLGDNFLLTKILPLIQQTSMTMGTIESPNIQGRNDTDLLERLQAAQNGSVIPKGLPKE